MKYDFFEEEPLESPKYKVGDEIVNIGDIENSTLTIAFDYLSLSSTSFCFDNPHISSADYCKLYGLKKDIYKIPINEFFDDTNIKKKFHFHNIDLYKKKFLIDKMKKLLNYNKYIEAYSLPTLYQIAGSFWQG